MTIGGRGRSASQFGAVTTRLTADEVEQVASQREWLRRLTAEELVAEYDGNRKRIEQLQAMLKVTKDASHVEALRHQVTLLQAINDSMAASAAEARRLVTTDVKHIFMRGGAAGGDPRFSQDALVSQVIGNLGASDPAMIAQAAMDTKFRETDRLKAAIVESGQTLGDRLGKVLRDFFPDAVVREVAKALDAELAGAR